MIHQEPCCFVKASDGNSDKDDSSADGSSQNFIALVHVPPTKDVVFVLWHNLDKAYRYKANMHNDYCNEGLKVHPCMTYTIIECQWTVING